MTARAQKADSDKTPDVVEVPENAVSRAGGEPKEDNTGLGVDASERDAKQAVRYEGRADELESEDEYVTVDGRDRDSAVLLLAAAEDLGLDQEVVLTTSEGFRVPASVRDKAFGKTGAKRPSPGDDNKE